MSQAITMPPIAQVTEVQKNYRTLFDQVKRSGLPLFLLRKNKPDVVILEPTFFQEIMYKADLYEEELALNRIKKGQQEHKQGRSKILRTIVDLMQGDEN
jgi:PHD/YefM family antitoxin component YafN of YafNO toxin-antitoxin module